MEIHMGKQLEAVLRTRGLSKQAFAGLVGPFLPTVKTKLRCPVCPIICVNAGALATHQALGHGWTRKERLKHPGVPTTSKQWVYEICQTRMWQPKTLIAVSSALKLKPEAFLHPYDESPERVA